MFIILFLWYDSFVRGGVMHELLCPVGNMECLYQAVLNGADAVYLSGKSYGARKFADNFSNEEIKKAISYCHLYGVRVYVTMNTLVKNEEVDAFLQQIEFLHKNGVDAVIMQDFGMICLVREIFPNLEIHASTQANNSSVDTVRLFYELGVKRVVFSREMSLKEIDEITIPIEKEVFIHGALCISYSGCCFMSCMIGGRSGNRGECAGSCRLPYRLYYQDRLLKDKEYLLSTKELNTSSKFKDLLNSSIYSFKIEGRMKSPEYVGFVTRFYRNLIDHNGCIENLNNENNQLKTLFNREFTPGHLFHTDSLMNTKSPNHIGLPIGKVIDVDSKRIKLKLEKQLNQGDGIRFLESGKGFVVNYLYDENGKLIHSSCDVCYLLNTIGLTKKETISKTYDSKLNKELQKLPKRKVPIRIFVSAKLGQKLVIRFCDDENEVEVMGNVVVQAKNAPISVDQIKKQVEKLGNCPFVSTNTKVISDDNIFIPVKEINELRRELVSKLIEKRTDLSIPFIKNKIDFPILDLEFVPSVTALVYNEEQLKRCLNLGLKRIYVVDISLYQKYRKTNTVYYKVPRCSFSILSGLQERNLVGDYFSFSLENAIGDYGLNVYNIYTAYYLYKLGLDVVTISIEFQEEEIIQFIKDFYHQFQFYPPIEIIGYGRVENMIIKGNILNIDKNDYQYELVDLRKRRFPVYFDGVNSYVLNYENFCIQNLDYIKKHCDIRLSFFDSSSKKIEKIVKYYQ